MTEDMKKDMDRWIRTLTPDEQKAWLQTMLRSVAAVQADMMVRTMQIVVDEHRKGGSREEQRARGQQALEHTYREMADDTQRDPNYRTVAGMMADGMEEKRSARRRREDRK